MKKTLVISALLILMLAGCLGSGQDSSPKENVVGTMVAQTQTAQAAVASAVEAALGTSAADVGTDSAEITAPTVGPGDAIPPEEAATENAGTESAPVESSTQVNFEPGGTRAAFDGSVGAGQVDEYVVRAMAGQILQITLTPLSGVVFLDIRGADGTNLIPDGSQWTSFWSSLPSTQDYKIKVISAGEAQSYSINIVVPAMIVFGVGESSQTINGHVGENTMADYLIYAQGGQEMHLTVTTPGVQVALSVTGMNDGQPYLRYVAETTDWTFTLPTTQYYKISVVTIAPATDFTLEVEVN
jgi:hypothetical protein